ncbi:BglII/BstYI family type II restriction endonuclease [Methylomagnum sp.]
MWPELIIIDTFFIGSHYEMLSLLSLIQSEHPESQYEVDIQRRHKQKIIKYLIIKLTDNSQAVLAINELHNILKTRQQPSNTQVAIKEAVRKIDMLASEHFREAIGTCLYGYLFYRWLGRNSAILKLNPLSKFMSFEFLYYYEVQNYNNAVQILSHNYPREFNEILQGLLSFRATLEDLRKPGGNNSPVSKRIYSLFRPKGWRETRFDSTHKIDFFKREIAFELEWNSKDYVFDRDLSAIRHLYKKKKVRPAVILTKSTLLNRKLKELGITKHGASHTSIEKLTKRLKAGQNGKCPVLAIGITPRLISDLTEY